MTNLVLARTSSRLFMFLKEEKMTNVTLTAEGKTIKAHKLMLAAASKYFEDLFVALNDQHPVIVLKDVAIKYLLLILEYIYCGQVDLSPEDVPEFNRVAASLQIKVELKLPHLESKHDQTMLEAMSQDFTNVSSTNLGEGSEEDTMDPSYEELMDATTAPFSISSVRSVNKRKAPAEPPLKKMKQDKMSQGAEQSNSKAKEAIHQCEHCKKIFKTREFNYHKKHCWKNPIRIVSDCHLCSNSYELPSRLRAHITQRHAEEST